MNYMDREIRLKLLLDAIERVPAFGVVRTYLC